VWIRAHRLNLLLDLLDWFSIHGSGDKEAHRYSSNVMRALYAELMGQGFMRVNGSLHIPRR
jgi:hypothetical protein